jgi:hypothetical protein
MFWAPLRPSSGAYNCTRSLWFYRWSVAVGALLVVVWQTMTNNAATVEEMEISSTVAASSSISWQYLKLYVVMCSWWWAEEQSETCRVSVKINKSRNVASCWLQFGIRNEKCVCFVMRAWLRAAHSNFSNFKYRKLKLQLHVIHRTEGVDPDSR